MILVTGVTAGCLMACGGGDDDDNGNPNDAGMMVLPDGRVITPPPTDGNPPPNPDGSMMMTDGGNPDGSMGTGCDFTDFVNDQITNHTANNTQSVPNAMIPQDPTCANTGSATQFSGLFH
jgi:hypothetical protein